MKVAGTLPSRNGSCTHIPCSAHPADSATPIPGDGADDPGPAPSTEARLWGMTFCVTATISVVVPCFNEAPNLGAVLDGIPDGCGIILVDDGSTDGTGEVARRHGARLVLLSQY